MIQLIEDTAVSLVFLAGIAWPLGEIILWSAR